MGYFDLDEEKYTAYGVIGGGIRSHLIYKLYPKMYPNRSREAVWALWYLTDKKKFGCKEDSEFLMINVKESTTQQNYFYPYALFSFYALEIYRFLKKLILGQSVNISEKQRFINSLLELFCIALILFNSILLPPLSIVSSTKVDEPILITDLNGKYGNFLYLGLNGEWEGCLLLIDGLNCVYFVLII